MRIMHLSDLHIGKSVNQFSMLEDQKYILDEILTIADEVKPQVVVIAGDVYDKTVPSAQAVTLLDYFLVELSLRNLKILVLSGNHDSAERIAFGSKLMEKSGIYMSTAYSNNFQKITFDDDWGKMNFYMLPFVRPSLVRAEFEDAEINSYTDAVSFSIEKMNVDENERNVLICHQFVTGASTCESEEISVGGSDNVDSSVFEPFDYVALGHIHGAQSVSRDTIRYCGTPLKYSFSEAKHKKSVTIVDYESEPIISTIPLIPKRDMREIRGTYMELTDKSFWENTNKNDYIHAILTDEEDILDVVAKLRIVYPNIMKISYDNTRTKKTMNITEVENIEEKSVIELFSEFYYLQNNKEFSEEQYEFLEDLVEDIWGMKE